MKSKCIKLFLKNIFHLITILFFLFVALDASQKEENIFSPTMNLTDLTEKNGTTNLN